MKTKHLFGAALCVLLACAARGQLLNDDFNDGVIDASKWQVILPFGQSSVVESSGTLTTTGKGILATVSNMPTTFSITGSFRLNNSLEICRVILRTDLSLHSGLAQYSERRGIWVTFHAANSALYIENGLQQGPPSVSRPYQWVIGQTYNYSIVDDSQNVSVLINGSTGLSLSITNRVGNKIAFCSREFSNTSSTFDNVQLSALSAVDSGKLSIKATNGQATVSWPAGLSLVQPQKRTNFSFDVWKDFGPATSAMNVTETASGSEAFYRLRFLAPNITTQPISRTNAVGNNVNFSVTATGTTPFAYQWRKNTTNLVGQNSAELGLSGVTTGDMGNYTVIITNLVGSATSVVASLTVTNVPVVIPPKGIYMGSFSGQADNGGFATLVRTNGQGVVVVGYNTTLVEGVYAANFTVAANGTCSVTMIQGGHASGIFTSTAVSGNFTNSFGATGTFSGTRKPDSGIHQVNAGYYVGTYGGYYSGNAYAVLAADGTIFFYTRSNTGVDGGGYGTVTSGNSVSATTVPDNLTVAGTLNPTTHVISGNYSFGGTVLGSYSVTLNTTP